ncbi:MAG: MFS transporter, partial [Alphaproteobacteria bacterium]
MGGVWRLSVGSRLSLFYAAVFTTVGIQLPFWPLWLQSRQLDAAEIGVVLATAAWTRMVAAPVAAHYVDQAHGRRRGAIVGLVVLSLGLAVLLSVTTGFWSLLAVNALLGGAFAAVIPLGDNLTLLATYRQNLDYGRIRLWGSLGFLLTAIAGGRMLMDTPPTAVLWAFS